MRETIGIPDCYEDLPECFFAMLGAIRSGPRVLGYEDARVEMEIEPRRAIYTIELPTRRVAPGGARAPADEILKAIDEMGAQLDELQATQAALREANLELEARVRERTHELLVSRARLEESHRLAALGTLAAGIAHEINNPLAAIQATAQLAQVTLRRDPGTRLEEAPLALIVDEARRGSRIVRGLLQFARGEAAEKWRIDMRTVVDRVVELARPHAHEAGVRIGVEPIDAVLPVVGNPIQLEQAVLNVLHNAIDASPITGVITVRVERLADVVRTSVVDRGRGIPEKDVPHIFDPFFTTRLDEGGTGLGLSTAHGILDQHGGRIEVESEVGVGTTVHLDLPLDRSGD